MMASKRTLQRWAKQISSPTNLVRKYIEEHPDSTPQEAIAILPKLSDKVTPQLIRGVYYRQKERTEKREFKQAQAELVLSMRAKHPNATYTELARLLKGKVKYSFISRTLGFENYLQKKVEFNSVPKPEIEKENQDNLSLAKQFIEASGGLDQAIEFLQTIKSIK